VWPDDVPFPEHAIERLGETSLAGLSIVP
jgi:hypothetical protein